MPRAIQSWVNSIYHGQFIYQLDFLKSDLQKVFKFHKSETWDIVL
jgi:hypothetical protein